MSTFTIVMIVILVILIGVLVGLYIFGKKAEKKQAEQQEQMAAAAQVVSMLIIDKKKLRLKEAGLPQMVVDNTPKYLRRTKVPVVKAKIGAKILSYRISSCMETPLLFRGTMLILMRQSAIGS